MGLGNCSMLIKPDKSLWACGYNELGQLGIYVNSGTTNGVANLTKSLDNVKFVCCGANHTLALKTDGSVLGCGYNAYGQLGVGVNVGTNNANSWYPVSTNVKWIACGSNHSLIVKNDGTLWACGLNMNGQLGTPSNSGSSNANYSWLQITSGVAQVACGNAHTVILKIDGTVWSFGHNYYGQLGVYTNNSTNTANPSLQLVCSGAIAIFCSQNSTYILKGDGSLLGCGYNYYGQLGPSTSGTSINTTLGLISNNVRTIACGLYHTIILKNDGTVWSCGYNRFGQLGTSVNAGTETANGTLIQVMDNCDKVSCGCYTTFIRKTDGSIWSCGYNNFGQLGNGVISPNYVNSFTNYPQYDGFSTLSENLIQVNYPTDVQQVQINFDDLKTHPDIKKIQVTDNFSQSKQITTYTPLTYVKDLQNGSLYKVRLNSHVSKVEVF